jgi:hypothetical protein
MDKKQREDAINEVILKMFLNNMRSTGPRFESHAPPLYHHLQGIFHGQEVSVHSHGLRGRRGSLHQDRKLKDLELNAQNVDMRL